MRRSLLLAVLAVAVLLRIYGLGKDGFWFDEASTMLLADRDAASVIELCSNNNSPPLYHLTLHFWLSGGRGVVWVRLLSLAFGVATVGVVWRLGNRLAGYPAGLYGALFIALSPVHVAYSQEARMYAMAGFWVAASFLSLWSWCRDRSAGWMACYAICTVAAMYTHLFCLLILPAQAAFVLLFSGLPARTKTWWIVCQVCVFVLFVPWVVVIARQLGRISEDFWLGQITPRAFLSLWPYLGTGGDFGNHYVLAAVLNIPLLLLLCAGAIALFRKSSRSAWFVVAWLIVPVLLAGILGLFLPLWLNRYLLIVSPAYALLMGSAIATQGRRMRTLLLILVVLILSVSLHYQYVFVSKTQVVPAVSYIEEHFRPGDCIVHHVLKSERKPRRKFDEDGWATFTYYPAIAYHGRKYPEFILARSKVPFYLWGSLLGPGEVVPDFESASSGYRRVWLVSWAKHEPLYGNEAAIRLAPGFRLVTSLKFPSPGNDTVSIYLLDRL